MAERQYFGTDGIRGVAGKAPLTADFAFKLGMAAAEVFKAAGREKPNFAIGMDTRKSGPMLAHALSAGLTARGADVIWLGIVPTPAVAFLTRHLRADAGIVVSASHNPFDDNGIKFFGDDGYKLSDNVEAEIERYLKESMPPVTGAGIGSSARYASRDDDYFKFLLSQAPYLDGLRLGIDCANGASFEIAPRIFREIDARLDVIHAKPDGVNINVNCGSTHIEALQQRVRALGLEVGVAFDGDADRALLVDRRGRVVSGDHILAICAVMRHEKAVVATIMTNLGVEHYLAERDIQLFRTRVGDRYVLEELRERGLTLGGEQSGHVLFLDKASTGDGILTALQTLAAVRKSGKPLERWLDEIPSYPQTLVNVRVEDKSKVAEHPGVQKAVQQAERRLSGLGRVNLRPSGTEPLIRIMVEGPSQEIVETIARDIAAAVESL